VGLPLTAFVWVRTGGANCAGVGPALVALGGDDGFIEECHRVTGELIDRVRAVAGVQATMTTLALSSLHGATEAAT
jgi:Lrp/AsnC family transcriptional regulator, leucine-responsive regulatory protein